MANYNHPNTFPENPLVVQPTPFEEYSKKYEGIFDLTKTEDGIVIAKMTWPGGGSTHWGIPMHKGIGSLCRDVGQDPTAEAFIIGGTGQNWIADVDDSVASNETTQADRLRNTHDMQYYDGTRMVEGLVNSLNIPTIGLLTGAGYHFEIALYCDVTLMAEEAKVYDIHYCSNLVPGDGIQIAMQMTMGLKRANYAMMTGEVIDAQKALEYGMVSEIVPRDQIYDRAIELARQFLKNDYLTRRISTEIFRKPFKEAIAKDLRLAFGQEMWQYAISDLTHDDLLETSAQNLEDCGVDTSNKIH